MTTSDKMSDGLTKCIQENCDSFNNGLYLYKEINCFLPTGFLDSEKRIRDLTVYEDDVWVMTFPKCGTTWAQEMVWLIGHDLNYKGAEVDVSFRFPFLEFSSLFAGDREMLQVVGNTIDTVEGTLRPRYIKSHLPLALLPAQLGQTKPKIVYVMRDPKDAAVSLYYQYRGIHGNRGSLEKFAQAFMEGNVNYGCYVHHIAAFWKLRHEPNILLLTFEEMKKDLPKVIKRTAAFFNKSVTDQQVATLAEHLSFAKMKENPAINYRDGAVAQAFHKKTGGRRDDNVQFMRKGEVGDHKQMSPDTIKRFDERITEVKQWLGLDIDKDFQY